MEQVLMATLVQLLFAAVLLYKHLLREQVNIYLVYLLGLGSFHMLLKMLLLWLLPGNHEYPLIVMPFCFVYAPLIYLYIRARLGRSVLQQRMWIHLLPFAVLLSCCLWLIVRHAWTGDSNQVYTQAIRYCFLPFQVFYALAILTQLSAARKRQPSTSTGTIVAVTLAVILLVQAPVALVGQLQVFVDWLSSIFIPGYYWLLLLLFLVLIYSHLAERQLLPVMHMAVPVAEPPADKVKYEKSGLEEDYLADCYEKLQGHMERTQLYKEAGLNLNELATQLSLPRHHLSQALNQQSGKNFFQYINEWRVQEICRLMLQEENTDNFLQLAYECGFNSKSSFNQNFKKIVGMTPSEYYEQHKVII
ncbi:helix-turn-helix transcriptional regulator [Chitinophaga pendula]|uniref:helix-turn-helix domain-containing protein n=1 Tax=Chitinophaga TaxID=79328 RepID=UPI000BAF8583|nr:MULTISPECIES: helix-turn-helix transcriptional regulator [Chitinophaga]ASZ13449.1 hypothetical protein CK934_22055 [Chitinophaga sp. MD30]UCJ08925.1 helix-turn-helix transcriptional regulator [Chitinophaga pendula]